MLPALLGFLLVYGFGALLFLGFSTERYSAPTLRPAFSTPILPTCGVNYAKVIARGVRPTGTFHALVTTSNHPQCFSIRNVTLNWPEKDEASYRVPFYSRDGARIYRCRAQTRGVEVLEGGGDQEQAFRACCLTGRSPSHNQTVTLAFLSSTKEGKLWLEAINRFQTLATHKFSLLPQQHWRQHLPAIPAHEALPEVNSHKYELPGRITQVLTGKNAMVERNGRIMFANGEVFYPKRAPYSHVALMETWLGGTQYQPSATKRLEFPKRLDQSRVQHCLSKVLVEGEVFPCHHADWIAVDSVIVISQTLGNQMFHHMCEGLPRLGTLLDFALGNPKVFVHVGCPIKAGYCLPLLELLGLPRERIVRGNVLARTVYVPEGGRRHWPIANLLGLQRLREQVLSNYVADHEQESGCLNNGLRVSLIKRKKTRLSEINPTWYDKLLAEFSQHTAESLKVNFNLSAEFVLFDDANNAVMNTALEQIRALRRSDIVVGAHGAGFAWMPYLKLCSHFISFRGRQNSDIFEQLGVGFGMGFHHVRFENDYESLFEQLHTSLGTAAHELVSNRLLGPVPLVCQTCEVGAIVRYLEMFSRVITQNESARGMDRVTVVATAGGEEDCGGGGVDLNERFAWVRSDSSVVLSATILRDWVPVSSFDALVFAPHVHAPAVFAVYRTVRACLAGIAQLDSVATVVSPFSAASASEWSLVYPVPIAKQDEFSALRQAVERNGTFHLIPGSDLGHGFGIVIRRGNALWTRNFPPESFVRANATAESLGEFGKVVGLKLPFVY
ncbi:hypothetical protein BASA82_001077 [Batrachochytrium salamandrivorans]|nr:hypothetical protein BASA82_001077 [Batrachochytrium salamandrivorans]